MDFYVVTGPQIWWKVHTKYFSNDKLQRRLAILKDYLLPQTKSDRTFWLVGYLDYQNFDK